MRKFWEVGCGLAHARELGLRTLGRVRVPGQPFRSGAMSGEWLNLSVPRFPPSRNRTVDAAVQFCRPSVRLKSV